MKVRFKLQIARSFLGVYLLVFVLELFAPLCAFALTSGPTQPEVQGFTPAGTSDMVDVFSGDFNYNIPLFELPGPNGGYPFNLSYQAGVTMDQEASWVGLGWSLTPGVVNRNMRGVPDDFNGDLVKTEMDVKKDYTAGVNSTFDMEIWTFDWLKGTAGWNIKYNSYRGFSAGQNFGASFSFAGAKAKGGIGLSINMDSDDGAGVDISGSVSDKSETFSGSVGLGISSRVGIRNLSLGFGFNPTTVQHYKDFKGEDQIKTKKNGVVNGNGNISFALGAFTPSISMPMKGFDISVLAKVGGDIAGMFMNFGLGGFYSEQKLAQHNKDSRAYGYLNLQNGKGKERDSNPGVLMDVSREKDGMVTKFTPNLAAPHLTYDVLSVTGQGMMSYYRPYRNDIGASFDEFVQSNTTGGGIGFEGGGGYPLHIGINGDINHSESWSGKWVNRNDFDYTYMSPEANSDFENVYFRARGEQTSEDPARMSSMVGGYSAIKLDLSGNRDVPRLTKNFSNADNAPTSVADSNARKTTPRKPRGNNIVPLKNTELAALNEFSVKYYKPTILSGGDVTDYQGTTNLENLDRTKRGTYNIQHHIGGISAINNEGMRYIYGIPAYNTKQVDAVFSVANPHPDPDPIVNVDEDYCRQKIDYLDGTGKNAYKNKSAQGTDNYFKKTSFPPYAHSYLLTAIIGPDYIDVDNNGPSEDDFGYWVKFNYVKANSNYKWRAPFEHNKANYLSGYKSDKFDDKGTYMYGEKEIWYLASAETKTHTAIFIMSERRDAIDAGGENTAGSNLYSYKLDRIELYENKEFNKIGITPKPIQTAHFKYNYELCGNHLPNNDGVTETVEGNNINANKGKLTLKSLYFTYERSSKGALSPYKFQYGNITGLGQQNPDYDPNAYDRWGNYKSDADSCNRMLFPYVNQSSGSTEQETRVKDITAWNLTDIHMPSGSDVHITYEPDDYNYVQDKEAMEMYKIKSLGDPSDPSKIYKWTSTSSSNRKADTAYDRDRRVFFELKDPIPISLPLSERQKLLEKYIDNTSQIYYKIYTPVRKYQGDPMWEYVSGYADLARIRISEVDSVECLDPLDDTKFRWACLILNYTRKNNNTPIRYHPFTLAALQSLKFNLPQFAYRGDLTKADPTAQGADLIFEMFKAIGAMFVSFKELFIAFYNEKTNYHNNWADRIDLDKSYIRLNSFDGVKYGGGLRVKKIEITDNWSSMASGENSATYGQEYDYSTKDENGRVISSGVATFEPEIGRDENALRYAKNYVQKLSVMTEKNLMYEYPINETIYPAPSVGYSQVTVTSLNTKRILASETSNTGYGSTGVTENHFYTAKDFPVVSSETTLFPEKDSRSMKYLLLPIPLPGLGSLRWDIMAASQGYVTELNDMHGKPKKTVNYAVDRQGRKIDIPISSVEYEYFCEKREFKKPGVEKPVSYQVLKNIVPVLITDPHPTDLTKAQIEDRMVGVDYELFTDQRQFFSYSAGGGLSFNIEFAYPFCPFPFPWPNINYSENEISLAVTNKVIYRSGILKKVTATDGQSIVSTENKVFDPYTGQPLLTTVNNNFDQPIWSYTIPAHVKYDGIGPAYKNLGINLKMDCGDFTQVNDSTYEITNNPACSNLVAGDELVLTGPMKAIVQATTETSATVIMTGDLVTGWCDSLEILGLRLIRSGRRNQLSVPAGKIVSLKDPTKDRQTDYCENSFQFVGQSTNTITDCLEELDFEAILDNISDKAIAAGSIPQLYVPLTDEIFTPWGSQISKLVSLGYTGITINPKGGNTVTFNNINGKNCVWAFYKVLTSQGAALPITSPPSKLFLRDLSSSDLLPMQTGGIFSHNMAVPLITGTEIFTLVGYKTSAHPTLPNTTQTIAFYQYPDDCFCSQMFPTTEQEDLVEYTDTLIWMDSVISSSATSYTDIWDNNFSDARFKTDPTYEKAYRISVANQYVNGKKGIWRNHKNFVYHTDRRQDADTVHIWRDGTYPMTMFDWRNPALSHCDTNWIKVNEITKYNAYNFETENKDALNNFSSALYSYNGKLPVALGANTKIQEFGFEGFEEYEPSQVYHSYNGSTGNLNIVTKTATLGNCSTVYNAYSFTAWDAGSGNYKICVDGFDAVDAVAVSGAKIHYDGGLKTPIGGSNASNNQFHTTGNLSNMKAFAFNATLANLSAGSSITFSEIHGVIEIPVCLPIPNEGSTISGVSVTARKAHTGRRSFQVQSPTSYTQFSLKLEAGKKYQFSTWVSRSSSYGQVHSYKQSNPVGTDNLSVEIYACDASGNLLSQLPIQTIMPNGPMINGWQKMDGTFTAIDAAFIQLKFIPGQALGQNVDAYFDDVRVFPYEGNMVSHIYNPLNYRLAATLDNNNFATFYYYDEQGNLYLKKQETEKGIFTIQEVRVNQPKQ